MAAKLERRGVAADVAAVALRRAETLGALDDAAFARAWVSDQGLRRGFATPRLRHELRRRLVPAPVVEAALAALDDRDDRDAATALARARAATLPASLAPPVVARRLEGFLVRRGYPPGVARPVAIAVSGMEAYRAWD